ncbi:alpha/beta hydrolase [Jannaschia sp. 2305UL9-9]|uniref:alpha/beta hydrolase n=1 Tax=Jannaschia sp. 2305UL9-9 TaxID=3121638 RepID=UPI003526FCC6
MPRLRIDAHHDGPRDAAGHAPWTALHRHIDPLPTGAPLAIVTHGMNHAPGWAAHDPHDGILSYCANPNRHWKSRSLVRCLHMGDGQVLSGHAITFGWDGRGTVWTAMRRASYAGAALARLACAIRRRRPDLRITVVAHSMGARVVIEAMLRAPLPVCDRALLLTPADSRARAGRALRAPGGAACTVVATQTPENWLCNLGMVAAMAGAADLSRGPDHLRWMDFYPDRSGLPVWPHRTCHWSCFLRRGVWPLYRAWVSGAAGASLFAPVAAPRLHSAADTPTVTASTA